MTEIKSRSYVSWDVHMPSKYFSNNQITAAGLNVIDQWLHTQGLYDFVAEKRYKFDFNEAYAEYLLKDGGIVTFTMEKNE